MAEKKKIIIDTDCGSDDAMAIAMALNDDAYEIQMFSTVSGNVNAEQATLNTLTTIERAGTYEPPVYAGARKMLLKDGPFCSGSLGGSFWKAAHPFQGLWSVCPTSTAGSAGQKQVNTLSMTETA